MNKVSCFCAACCAVILLAGCDRGGPRVVTAEGTIQLKGAPLNGATIIVRYADGDAAQDVSHEGGKFALTYHGKPGAPPGTKLKVSVHTAAAPYSAPPRSDKSPPDPAGRTSTGDLKIMIDGTAEAKSGKRPSTPPAEVDAQYELTIPEGGSKALKIELP